MPLSTQNNRIKIFLCAFCLYGECAFSKEATIYNSLTDGLVHLLCDDLEAAKCLSISKLKCSKNVKKALVYCPNNKIDGSTLEIPDAVCITDEFFKLSGRSDTLIQNCEVPKDLKLPKAPVTEK